MPSSTDTDALARLASSLAAGLSGASFSEVQVGEGLSPLLIAQAGHLVAAFALGEDESAYDALYPAFKKYFMSRSAEWSAKDVSFVYCLPPLARAIRGVLLSCRGGRLLLQKVRRSTD